MPKFLVEVIFIKEVYAKDDEEAYNMGKDYVENHKKIDDWDHVATTEIPVEH